MEIIYSWNNICQSRQLMKMCSKETEALDLASDVPATKKIVKEKEHLISKYKLSTYQD